jgi:membrane protease YdiL (CAAX protease family)
MMRWLGQIIGVRGRLETTIWAAAAIAVCALLWASLHGGVSTRVHGVLLGLPWILILVLAAVRARRRKHDHHVHNQ